jgi:hypothetical protein
MMYFVTGLLMAHEDIVARGTPTKSTSEHVLAYSGPWTTKSLGPYLQHSLDLAGRLAGSSSNDDGSFSFRFANAGIQIEALVPPSRDKVSLVRSKPTLVWKAHAMHRFHGYGGGWFYNLWAVMLDLSSLALIAFAVTGTILWHQLSKRQIVGWIFLGAGMAYSVGMILFFYSAP